MAGPSWLAWAFASVVIIVAGYCLTRLVASWRQHRPSDHRVDAIHVLMGVAMAGMLVPRLAVFWVGGWEVVFGMGAAWFGWLAIREFRAGRRWAGGLVIICSTCSAAGRCCTCSWPRPPSPRPPPGGQR